MITMFDLVFDDRTHNRLDEMSSKLDKMGTIDKII